MTFDLRYDFDIQRKQRLNTGHVHLQISSLYYEGIRCYTFFYMIVGKCRNIK